MYVRALQSTLEHNNTGCLLADSCYIPLKKLEKKLDYSCYCLFVVISSHNAMSPTERNKQQQKSTTTTKEFVKYTKNQKVVSINISDLLNFCIF